MLPYVPVRLPHVIVCKLPDGVTVACTEGRTITPGFNGIVDQTTYERCSHWSWIPAYTGTCTRGSPCEGVTEDGRYIDGTCL